MRQFDPDGPNHLLDGDRRKERPGLLAQRIREAAMNKITADRFA
ncbi:MAG: hypothetical protein OXI81_15050 [Paracoccaceae bacterium]|nr:hypothetical protein [Paracoccaceae bacterium]MDE2912201.1 hypothetical protein [Paracoccaceae bacterium]